MGGGKSGDETFRLAFGIGLRVPNVRSGSILRYFSCPQLLTA